MSKLRAAPALAIALAAVATGAAGCSGGGGGGGGAAPAPGGSQPESGTFVGRIVDADGAPVAGAIVSVDGIASDPTGPDGRFAVSSAELAVIAAPVNAGQIAPAITSQNEVTVYAPGTEGGVFDVAFAGGSVPELAVLRNGIAAQLEVVSPHPGAVFIVPETCASPLVRVEGYVALELQDGLALDVVLLIDRSGSVDRPVAFDVAIAGVAGTEGLPDTVLGAEVAAALSFVDSLDTRQVRASVIAFADRGRTKVMAGFTREKTALAAALLAIVDDPERGGTDYAEAFDAARAAFAGAPALGGDDADEPPVAPSRVVCMLSDGIPTSPFGSNLTQEREDRVAATEAAKLLAQEAITLEAFAILSALAPADQKLTTLPACAAITGGDFRRIDDASALVGALCGQALADVARVVVRNQDIPDSDVVATLRPDGFFSAEVALQTAPGPGVGSNNRIEVEIVPEDPALTARRVIPVTLVSRAVVGNQDFEVLQLDPVADVGIVTPQGDAPGNDQLATFLAAEFPDARQLRGVEAFTIPGLPGTDVTVQVDVVFESAGFESDFGYFTFDPQNPPTTAAEALATAVKIFDTVGFAPPGGTVADGAARFTPDLPAGTGLGFFIVPDDTLQNAIDGTAANAPLFTIPSLDPGGLAQVLAFDSDAGRIGAGHPDVTVLAFEDLAIARRRGSDRDFNDIVFTVDFVRAAAPEVTCK